MSLSTEAKTELFAQEINWECCLTAALSAVIHTAGSISFSSDGMAVIVDLSHGGALEFVNDAVEKLFGGEAISKDGKIFIGGDFVDDMLLCLKILRLSADFDDGISDDGSSVNSVENIVNNSDNVVGVSSGLLSPSISVVEEIDSQLIEEDCCKRAYLIGAFIGCGSIAVSRGYHLEFSCASRRLRDGLIWLLDCFGVKAGEATSRSGNFLAYIKDKDLISDLLALVGAGKTMLKLNAILVERSVKQDAARAVNCDEANLNRLANASAIQQEAIKRLGEIKNERLSEVAAARLSHPHYSYDELAAVLGVSKSTIKYRLNKLTKMAENLDR